MASGKDAEAGGGRGAKARNQMLAAGMEAFARFGPEGVTTRRLAAAAGVNSAAIQYYFGSKEGYYRAVVRHLVEKLARPFFAELEEIAARLHDSVPDRWEAAALLDRLVRRMWILVAPEARFFAGISAREHLNPTGAYEIIYEAISRIHRILAALAASALGVSPESPAAVVRAHAVFGQAMIFRTGAATLCRRLGVEEIDEPEAERIAAVVAEMACRGFGLEPAAEPSERSGRSGR